MFYFSLVLLGCGPKSPPDAMAPERPVTLHIAALNDFHGSLYEAPARKEEGLAYGGLPWLVSAVDKLRADHDDLLLLDGGDLFQGSWPVNQSAGMGAVKAYNLLGVDAAAVGNHEFDYGNAIGDHPLRGALMEGAKQANFAWLAANIQEDGKPWSPEGITATTMLERRGVKIGVIGLSTEDTPQTTLTKNVADLEFTSVVDAVKEHAPRLRSEGAEVVVGIGHLTGHCAPQTYTDAGEPCTPEGEIGALLEELPEGTLDVLVVGHAHSLMHHRIGKTFIMEQRAKGHAIGRLDLVVTEEGVDHDASTIMEPWFLKHEAVDPGCSDDPFPRAELEVGGTLLSPSQAALSLIHTLEEEAGSLCDPVGCSPAAMGRTRQAESAVGDVISDAMLAAFEGADLALQNSGGLRADLPEGEVRGEHVQAVMPFDNRLLMVEATGEQLLEILRVGSSGAHGILQLAGGSYGFHPEHLEDTDRNGDGRAEEWERDRLCEERVMVGGKAVDLEASYTIVTTDFLIGGGDHLGPALGSLKVVDQGPLLRDAISDYFSSFEEGTCVPEPDLARISLAKCR